MGLFRFILSIGLLGGSIIAAAQTKPTTLRNASFEGIPHDAVTPREWQACGLDSSPDILPGPWGVYQKPTHGNSFMGLITRENNSWEAAGQALSKPLLKDRCYKVQVDLANSPAYAGYNKPTCLRIWGSNSPCERSELLAVSTAVNHYEWKTYEFIFAPLQDYRYIIVECYYRTPVLEYYRGNLLIDNFTAFEACDRA
jgi:hypothetical protein